MRARELQLRMSLQQLHEMGTSDGPLQLPFATTGSWLQKPANEGDPKSDKARTTKETPYSIENEDKGDNLARPGSDVGRALDILGNRPDNGAENSAAIERKSGNHIKDSEQDVDVSKPDEDRGHSRVRLGQTTPPKAGREREAAKPDNEAGRGPGDRHLEFGLRVAGFILSA